MSSPSEQNPVITTETVKPALDLFFGDLSPEQWIRLATGTADQSITCALAELLGDTMELFVASALDRLRREELTTELVGDVVGNVVPEAFTQAMEIKEEVRSKSTENLNRLILKHVMERVKSSLRSDDEDPADSYIQKVNGIYRTNAVVQEATVVIQELISWMCRPPLESKQVAIINPQPVNKDEVNSGGPKRSASQKAFPAEGPQTEELTDKDKNQNKSAASSTNRESKVNALKRKIKMFFSKYCRKHSSEVAPANLPKVKGQRGSGCTPPGGRLAPVDKDPEVTPKDADEDANVACVEKFIPEDQVSEITPVREGVAEDRPAEVSQVEDIQPDNKFYETTPIEDFLPQDEVSEIPSVREGVAEDRPAEVSQVEDIQPDNKSYETTPIEDFLPQDEVSEIPFVQAEDRPADVVDKDPEVTPKDADEDANVACVEKFIPEDQVSEITPVREGVAEDRPAEVSQVEDIQPDNKFYETTPIEDFLPQDEVSEIPSVREGVAEDRPAEVSQVEDIQPDNKSYETTPIEDFLPQDEVSEIPFVRAEDRPAEVSQMQPDHKFYETTLVEEFIPQDEVSKVTSVREGVAEDRPAEVTQVEVRQSDHKFYESTAVVDFVPENEVSKVTSASVVEEVESGEDKLDLSQPEVCPAVARTIVPQVSVSSDEETQEQASDVKDEEEKALVSMLVHGLVAQAVEMSNIRCSPEDLQATHGRLFGKIWAQVQGEEIRVEPARTLNHSKKIYDSICKALRCPCEIVGALLLLENATFDKAVVSSFMKHLTRSAEKAFLAQFFSAVGNAMSKPFRQTGTECPKSIQPEDSSRGNQAAEDEVSSDSKQDSGSAPTAGIPEDNTAPTADSNQEENQQETEEVEERKVAVRTLISDLIWQIIETSGQSYPKERYHTICERLFQQLWAQVKDRLHSLSPGKIRSLDRVIFKDLCEKWDKPENLLVHLDLGRPLIDKAVLSSFESHLLNPSKMLGGIRNLFQNLQETLQRCPTRIYIVL